MNEKVNVEVLVRVKVFEGERSYYSDKKAEIENTFVVPIGVYNAINYSDIITAMVKNTIEQYENPEKEDEDE